jgi:hypothetical protein
MGVNVGKRRLARGDDSEKRMVASRISPDASSHSSTALCMTGALVTPPEPEARRVLPERSILGYSEKRLRQGVEKV